MRIPPRHSFPSLTAFAVLALSSALLSPSARANLVVNGGFEDVASETFATGGVLAGGGSTVWIDGTLAGWQTGPATNSPNAIATNHEPYFDPNTGGLFSGPHSGSLAAVFPNTPDFDGYISQAVTGTVAGQWYKIGFWLSNQVGDAAHNSMSVNWGGTIATPGDPIVGGTDLFGPVAVPVPTAWTYYQFDAQAPTDNARLSFIGGDTAAGNLIDDVIVVVPEVSSFGTLMGIGLFALGTTARFRRRVSVAA